MSSLPQYPSSSRTDILDDKRLAPPDGDVEKASSTGTSLTGDPAVHEKAEAEAPPRNVSGFAVRGNLHLCASLHKLTVR